MRVSVCVCLCACVCVCASVCVSLCCMYILSGAGTERGDWNCEDSTMKERIAQIKADNVPELAIFILRPDEGPDEKCSTRLNPDGEPMCPCSNKWFPLARDFLAGAL